jgi:cytochrome c-type biogenesis protein CcmH
MNRREWVGQASAILLFAAPPRRRAAEPPSHRASQAIGRDTLPSGRPAVLPPGQADRLYDPSVVQERAPATAADNDPAIKELEHRLKCTCGCNLDIYTCRTTDFTCTYSPALHQEVLALRKDGKNDEAVIEAFVAKYGESILMSPKPQGFNLAGYLLPGILVASIALILAWVLMRRSRLTRAVAESPSRAAETTSRQAAESAADDERLKRALEEVED